MWYYGYVNKREQHREEVTELEIVLQYGKIDWRFTASEKGVYRAIRPGRVSDEHLDYAATLAPICEVQIRGRMTEAHMGGRRIQCSETGRFAYASHSLTEDEKGAQLTIVQKSDVAQLTSYLTVAAGTDTVRIRHEIQNIGETPFTVEYIGTYGDILLTEPNTFDTTELWIPTNGSCCECQWNRNTLKQWGVYGGRNMRSTKKLLISNTGTWSTKNYLPMGALRDASGHMTVWQIEANGSWSYELSDLWDSVTLHLNGPTFDDHNWQQTLAPGETFGTVAAAVTEGGDFNECMAHMTAYRRSIVRRTADAQNQPIIFNEYMYASWNTPSAQTAAELAPIAAKFGAEYYVIDCGWHDEPADPFYHVGGWQESRSRYPEGLSKTLDMIRSYGLIPGLWMEPEVVGAKGDAKSLYTDDCYFSHGGVVLGISNRYQLDFRNKTVTDRLDRIVDELVGTYGVGYIKFDYNIEAGVGTDRRAESCGQGLLGHNRAVYEWVRSIGARHPGLVIENCASGGNRMDYLTMQVSDMQSTSDQIDYRVYPYIAANMFSALLPEQAAVWAYPAAHADVEQPDAECTIMNMVNGMAGRMHLASRLDWLDAANAALVCEATAFYKTLSAFRAAAVPYFEGGVPTDMYAGQIVYGLQNEHEILLFVYRMDGTETVSIRPGVRVRQAETVYPADSKIQPETDGTTVRIQFPQPYTARVIRLTVAR